MYPTQFRYPGRELSANTQVGIFFLRYYFQILKETIKITIHEKQKTFDPKKQVYFGAWGVKTHWKTVLSENYQTPVPRRDDCVKKKSTKLNILTVAFSTFIVFS